MHTAMFLFSYKTKKVTFTGVPKTIEPDAANPFASIAQNYSFGSPGKRMMEPTSRAETQKQRPSVH